MLKEIKIFIVATTLSVIANPLYAFGCSNCVNEITFQSWRAQWVAQNQALQLWLNTRLLPQIGGVASQLMVESTKNLEATKTATENLLNQNTNKTKVDKQLEIIDDYEINSSPTSPCITGVSAETTSVAKDSADTLTRRTVRSLLEEQYSADNYLSRAYNRYKKLYAKGKALADADITASTVLEKNTYNAKGETAAKDFIRNVTAFPLEVPITTEDNSQKTKEDIAKQRSVYARKNISTDAFSASFGKRLPVKNIHRQLNKIWQSMSEAIAPDTSKLKKDISYQQFMDIEIARRYANPDWYVNSSRASQANLARENLYMTALDLYLQSEILHQLERISLLLASINLNTIEN